MEAAAASQGGRSLIERHNPETLVLAPPDANIVSVSLDLGSSFAALTYDRLRAEALHNELGVAIELMGEKRHAGTRRFEDAF